MLSCYYFWRLERKSEFGNALCMKSVYGIYSAGSLGLSRTMVCLICVDKAVISFKDKVESMVFVHMVRCIVREAFNLKIYIFFVLSS